MLDENLPTFFLKPSQDKVKHHQAFYLSQYGSEPEAIYSLRKPDPTSAAARNCYAVALFDSYNPDVLFGEILCRPDWTQPSLSQEEIRKNGGVPPPPTPIIPDSFTIQLYNPDQQVAVSQHTGFWTGSSSFAFSLPQTSFRTPSASALDRGLSDPGADPVTPQINFVWRRESRLSKDLTCFMTGKSTDPAPAKKRNRDPDIAIALCSNGLRELTVLESNLCRVELEDYKGLEVVLLLSAAAIKDIYFGNVKETFHIGVDSGVPRKNSAGAALGLLGRKMSSPLDPAATAAKSTPSPPVPGPPVAPHGKGSSSPSNLNQHHPQSFAARTSAATSASASNPALPPLDPLAQWASDAETARLRQAAEAEERQRERDRRRRAVEAERQTRKLLEQEERERRRREEEVRRETERLRKVYGSGAHGVGSQPMQPMQSQPQPQPRWGAASAPAQQPPPPRWGSSAAAAVPMAPPPSAPAPARPLPPPPPPPPGTGRWNTGPYLHPGLTAGSSVSFFGGGSQYGQGQGQGQERKKMARKSLFGLRREEERGSGTGTGSGSGVLRKKSSVW